MSILLRATFIASADSSAFVIVSAIAFFSFFAPPRQTFPSQPNLFLSGIFQAVPAAAVILPVKGILCVNQRILITHDNQSGAVNHGDRTQRGLSAKFIFCTGSFIKFRKTESALCNIIRAGSNPFSGGIPGKIAGYGERGKDKCRQQCSGEKRSLHGTPPIQRIFSSKNTPPPAWFCQAGCGIIPA